MMNRISGLLLGEVFPRCLDPDGWAEPLSHACALAAINTRARIAAFLGQVGHESNSLNTLVENLNYSAERLTQVWPHRFPTLPSATPYARNPEKLANFVYASRLGNEASGDGYRYRGRGLIQTTGRSNYVAAETFSKLPLVAHPELLQEKTPAAIAAAAFWQSKGLNVRADSGDIEGITRLVNGGLLGLDDRKAITQRALEALA